MLAAQLAHPPATNHTMVGLLRRDAIVATVPAGVAKVPLGAGASDADRDADADRNASADRDAVVTWRSGTARGTLALASPPPVPATA